MTAVTGIAVINGKPTASAQLIGGLVRRAGHKLRVESSDTKAVAAIIRADDPDFEFRVEWTMERARKAGLGDRGPWRTYPAAMLTARAITEVARMAAPEALFGIIYTPEELGATVDGDGDVIEATTIEVQSEPVQLGEVERETVVGRIIATDQVDVITAEKVYEEMQTKPIARNQTTRIAILRKSLGIDDDAYRARLQSLYNVRSSKDLTQAQAADLIEKLTAAQSRGKDHAPTA